ncbi:MAG: Gfo/Idh/MocA family oxidoreductase [Bacteroidota bacterium]|nr:Gfo/Idh/MocA family oxidoreductase [Bacteroidota bacterium]MDP4207081.1 Gfo/Idh/MocA family oxidoreductase [Bacteroidota bacterium]
MENIKWGIIGCGDVTEVKSGPAFKQIKNSELIAVMRRNGELAQDYAQRHHVPKWYDQADDLINDPEVNTIYIATPPDTHALYAIKAMKAGKAVYVEKPMARNYEECREMIRVSEETGIPLITAYYRRSLPMFLKVKELIDADEIGKPLLVNIRFYRSPAPEDLQKENLPWRVIPEISGGGYFVDLASHTLDFLDYLFGSITEVQGFALNRAGLYPAEDTVTATFRFESDVIGNGAWCFCASNNVDVDYVEIVGEKGRLRFSMFKFSPIILKAPGEEREFYYEKPTHVQLHHLRTVVDQLQGKGPCPSSMYSASRTNRVIDQILSNYYSPKK